jgi:hypothetical protein
MSTSKKTEQAMAEMANQIAALAAAQEKQQQQMASLLQVLQGLVQQQQLQQPQQPQQPQQHRQQQDVQGDFRCAKFEPHERVFVCSVYNGPNAPRFEPTKVKRREHKEKVLPSTIWTNPRPIEVCVRVLNEIGQYCMDNRWKDDDAVVVFKALWKKAGDAKWEFGKALKKAKTVADITRALSEWIATDISISAHVSQREQVKQDKDESLATYIERVEPWIFEIEDTVPQWKWLRDTLILRLDESWKTKYATSLMKELRQFLRLAIADANLTEDQKRGISFQTLRVWMDDIDRKDFCHAGIKTDSFGSEEVETDDSHGVTKLKTKRRDARSKEANSETKTKDKKSKSHGDNSGKPDAGSKKTRGPKCPACGGNHRYDDCDNIGAIKELAKNNFKRLKAMEEHDQSGDEQESSANTLKKPPDKSKKTDTEKVAEYEKQLAKLAVKMLKLKDGKSTPETEEGFRIPGVY